METERAKGGFYLLQEQNERSCLQHTAVILGAPAQVLETTEEASIKSVVQTASLACPFVQGGLQV